MDTNNYNIPEGFDYLNEKLSFIANQIAVNENAIDRKFADYLLNLLQETKDLSVSIQNEYLKNHPEEINKNGPSL